MSALSIGIVTIYVLFYVVFFSRSGPKDGDQFLVFHSLQFWNASLFGMAKQWTPLMCSGLSMAGEPQVPFMSLSMALSYLLGPLWGVRLSSAIYLSAGWTGAFLYAGLWLRQKAQRTLAAALFVGNGFFFCRLSFGHFDFVPFLILPLLLWVLHLGIAWSTEPWTAHKPVRWMLMILLMSAALALAIDGSPVAIIHLLFWIGLYAVALTVVARSAAPMVMFACAVGAAGILDAGYLWPMLQAQAAFPRLTPDRFTSAFSLLWFAVLPMRGKVLPANGNGHELSVFIGPVLMYCLWRYRHCLSANIPREMGRPLLVVSLASIVLGMGSLRALHIPSWLSPFDALRHLPGFRSIGVTGRYWGFLALPLSLLSAAALWKYVAEFGEGWRLHVCLGLALIFQLGFQAETLASLWLHSPHYSLASHRNYFRHGPEDIDYVEIQDERLQGQVIAPTRGVSDCYDMDDFTRAETGSGKGLVMRTMREWKPSNTAAEVHARFSTWSHIRLSLECPLFGGDSSCRISPAEHMQMVLRQAYHPLWKASGCDTYAATRGNLIVDCPIARMRERPIELDFRDSTSDVAALVSSMSWKSWLLATALMILQWIALGIRGGVGLARI
ncbi:MAG: hypothetical protein M3O41_07140 [Pseudomonadota bacterium]|nr:hypothetical protein [Pseudomonadota bacterium]